MRPETAALISCAGGGLVLAQALFFGLGGDLLVVGLLIGGAIMALGAATSSRVRNREAIGVLVAVFGIVSLFTVSGFFLGAILAVAGGILIVSTRSSASITGRSSLYAAPSLGPPCPKCGHAVPTWSARCPYCGFPDTVSE